MSVADADSRSDYTEAEQRRLALNLQAINEQIHKGDLLDRPPTVDLLCSIHDRLFRDVRNHAGQIRRPGFGSSYLTFGPNRSVSNEEFPDQLLDTFSRLQRAISSFEANPEIEGTILIVRLARRGGSPERQA